MKPKTEIIDGWEYRCPERPVKLKGWRRVWRLGRLRLVEVFAKILFVPLYGRARWNYTHCVNNKLYVGSSSDSSFYTTPLVCYRRVRDADSYMGRLRSRILNLLGL